MHQGDQFLIFLFRSLLHKHMHMWYEIDGFWNNKVEEKLQKYWSHQVHEDIVITFKKNKTKPTTTPQNPASLDKALF